MHSPVQEREPATAHERVVNLYEQRYHDTTTLAAEMLDGSMQTTFEYTFDDKEEELYSQEGCALGEVFKKAEAQAYELAADDPRLECEIRRRGPNCELGEYFDMIQLAKGLGPNTIVTVSDAPAELLEWGEDLLGYSHERMKTMLRVISRLPNGNIRVTSQSLDLSDRDALESIYTYLGQTPKPGELLGQRIKKDIDPERQELLADELTREHDRTLERKFGGRFFAGRTPADMDNTYQFVRQQDDLLDVFMKDTNDNNLLGLIAALDNRWKIRKSDQGLLLKTENFVVTRIGMSPEVEMHHMRQLAIQLGKIYSGCGLTITAENELEALGFGGKKPEKQKWYGAYKKVGTCVNCEEEDIEVGEQSWCQLCISGHCGTK